MTEQRLKNLTSAEKVISIVILAGGQGRRMGSQDKGLVTLAGKPMIEHVIGAISPQNQQIIINANQNIARYEAYGYPVVSDELSGFQGPLAGIACAMKAVKTPYILTLPCDAPLIASDYQQRMWLALQTQQTDLVVAYDGKRLQSIHALLPTHLCSSIEQFLATKERRLAAFYSRYALGLVDFSAQAAMFKNINTRQDQQDYAASIQS